MALYIWVTLLTSCQTMTFSRRALLYEVSTRKQETHTRILLYILSVSDHEADKSKWNSFKWWMFLSRLRVIFIRLLTLQ